LQEPFDIDSMETNSEFDYDLAVIGAGTAGLVSAFVADSLGAKVALIERDKVGGECLWRGCVPSKALIKSAKVFEMVKRCEEFGVHIEKPKLVWNAVRLRLADVRDDIKNLEREQLAKSNITQITASAKFLDSNTLELTEKSGVRTIRAKKFVLATGSKAIIPEIEGLTEVGYLAPHDLFSRPNMPKSLIFLGGGPINCELAQAFHRFGTRVVVLQSADQLLPKEERDVADKLHEIFRNEGIEVHLNAKATKVEVSGPYKKVTFTVDGEEREAQAGEIVLGIGKTPDLDTLNLEVTGVEIVDGAVKVDASLRTTAKNIWACGDVLGKYLFTHVAEHEAKVAGANAVLPAPLARKIDYKGLVWVTFTDPEVAHVGLTFDEANQLGKVRNWDVPFKTLDRAIIEGETAGFARITTSGSGRILGATIIGPSAGEIITALVPAVREGALLHEFAEMMLPYPTLGEILHRAGNEAYQELLNSPLAQKAIKILPK
jgi:pyruvate/2-oxoglutarate dehydrogenase complex dihydrolipoamide dehydrogenase (E3) component